VYPSGPARGWFAQVPRTGLFEIPGEDDGDLIESVLSLVTRKQNTDGRSSSSCVTACRRVIAGNGLSNQMRRPGSVSYINHPKLYRDQRRPCCRAHRESYMVGNLVGGPPSNQPRQRAAQVRERSKTITWDRSVGENSGGVSSAAESKVDWNHMC